jgi:hypothetical protein
MKLKAKYVKLKRLKNKSKSYYIKIYHLLGEIMKDLPANEFYKSLVVPLPLRSIERDMAKRHVVNRNMVKKLIDDYIKTSSEHFEAMANLMLEMMNSEVSFQEPNAEIIEEFYRRMERLDDRFKYIDEFMKELDEKDRNIILMDNFDHTVYLLRNNRAKVLENLKSKEEWNENDVLFLSYYDRYTDFLDLIALEAKRDKKISNSNKGLLYFLAFLYQVVIYAYFKESLKREVMLRRYSELIFMTKDSSKRRTKLQKEILSSLRMLPPPDQ